MSGSTCYNLKNGFGFFLRGNAPGDYNPDTDPTGLEREEAQVTARRTRRNQASLVFELSANPAFRRRSTADHHRPFRT